MSTNEGFYYLYMYISVQDNAEVQVHKGINYCIIW